MEEEDNGKDSTSKVGKKRKMSEYEEINGTGQQKKHRNAKSHVSKKTQYSQYCYCGGPSSGTMIGCDGHDCEAEWFHVQCVGLIKEMPPEKEAWFYRECEAT